MSDMTEKQRNLIISMGIDPDIIIEPAGIEEWIKNQNHPFLKNRFRIASDGTQIDLGWIRHHFAKMIEPYSTEEKAKFNKFKEIYDQALGKFSRSKQIVFGVNAKNRTTDLASTKMLARKQAELIELFGRYYSVTEVNEIIVKDWGIPVSRGTIEKFLEEHGETIKDKRETYKQSYSDVRLGHKRSRLDEMTWIYKTLKKKYAETESREDLRLMLGVIKQIKEEVEIETSALNINLSGGYSIEQTITTHVKKELHINHNLGIIIMSKIAQKEGVDPNQILYRMNNSFYNKFLNAADGSYSPIDAKHLPSASDYDFDAISRVQKEKDKEMKIYLDQQKKELDDETLLPEGALDLKEALLRTMKEKFKSIDDFRNRLNLNISKDPSNIAEEIEYEKMDTDEPIRKVVNRKLKSEKQPVKPPVKKKKK